MSEKKYNFYCRLASNYDEYDLTSYDNLSVKDHIIGIAHCINIVLSIFYGWQIGGLGGLIIFPIISETIITLLIKYTIPLIMLILEKTLPLLMGIAALFILAVVIMLFQFLWGYKF